MRALRCGDSDTLRLMFFMVIERFKRRDLAPVGERFQRHGRMLPEGVTYRASWMDAAGTRCFQLMEAADAESLTPGSAVRRIWWSSRLSSSDLRRLLVQSARGLKGNDNGRPQALA